jgi:hypothetical protein
MSGRSKRVLVYTVSLLAAPLPVMPWAKGTYEFVVSLVPCGVILALGSFYALRGELRLRARGLLGQKLVAASAITLLFGAALFVGSLVYLLLPRS